MNKYIPIILGILLVCLSVWLFITPIKIVRTLFDRLDLLAYDLQLRTRVLTQPTHPKTPIAIVDIDDKSLQAEGRWPWERSKLAKLVEELDKLGAAVIAFDIFFSEQQPNIAIQMQDFLNSKHLLSAQVAQALEKSAPYLDQDVIFSKSLASSTSLLAVGFLPTPQTVNVLPPPIFSLSPEEDFELSITTAAGYIGNIPTLQNAAKGGGFINIIADSDGIIRHAPLLMAYKNNIYPALSLRAALTYLNKNARLITPTYNEGKKLEGIQIGERIIPTDEKGQALIPFIGGSYTFPYYSATDILRGKIAKEKIQGKILFIGTSATGMGDLQTTSIQSPFPGVEVQATLVNGILEGNFSSIPAWTFGANLFLTIILGLIGACLFPFLGPRTLFSVIILLPPSILFLNNWFWIKTGLVISMLIPTILILVLAVLNIMYGYLFETRRREQIKEMFGQYVPSKHIDEMLKTRGDYGFRGEDRDMTVLFADIRNFTAISESRTAAELVELLNTFFTPMTEIIFNHKGTIDKYVGDLIMAFWSAPLKDKHHASHAIISALEMQKKIKEMQPIFAKYNCPDLKIGIGLNSGLMSVGNMGSRYRRNYTVMGDQVNLASRVEGLTKFYNVDIIVTEYTEHHQPKFVFRKLDKVRVRGKTVGVEIYELICKREELTPEAAHELTRYHQAISHYANQDWEDAEKILTELQQTYGQKRIYTIYLERIATLKSQPKQIDWDRTYTHLEK